jgi:hypothetical protein
MRLAPRKKPGVCFINVLYIKQIYEIFQRNWNFCLKNEDVARVFYFSRYFYRSQFYNRWKYVNIQNLEGICKGISLRANALKYFNSDIVPKTTPTMLQ